MIEMESDMDNAPSDQEISVVSLLKNAKKRLFGAIFLSVLITLLSAAIIGTQLFYPYHFVIGISIYMLSYIPLVYRLYLSRKTWMRCREYGFVRDFYGVEKKKIILAGIAITLTMSFFVIRPVDANPYKGLSDDELKSLVADDLYTSIVAMDYLETSGNTLLEILRAEQNDTNVTEDIGTAFEDFLTAVVLSESLTDVHRYFDKIPGHLSMERTASFLISYSLYVKKYETVHRMLTTVANSEYHKKVLNQHISSHGRSGLYSEMVEYFYYPKTHLRLNAGAIYLHLLDMTHYGAENQEPLTLLYGKAATSYDYLLAYFGDTLMNTGTVVADAAQNKIFDLWFPIQRGVANGMGHTILSTRGKDYFITAAQIETMEQEMEPGDIMLQRRNWHLSNVGIPGFWTHSALYTGSLEQMDEYFATEFPYKGFDSMSAYLETSIPETYEQFLSPDTDGQTRTVIEAIEPGVVIQSLHLSAYADSVVTLRPNLNKKAKMLALLKAFENFGKPYDYNFDFETRDALVCSELIYDSFFERLPEKDGLHFDTSVVNGRKITTPLDMAVKYTEEYGTNTNELSFVYFLRGSEENKVAEVSDRDTFMDSVTWSKFTFLQEDQ